MGVYTWNLGGVKAYEHIDMKEWLLPKLKSAADMPDILVIGLQGIIPLKSSRMFASNRDEAEFVKGAILKNLYNYASQE